MRHCNCVRHLRKFSDLRFCDGFCKVVDDGNNAKLYVVMEYIPGGQIMHWTSNWNCYSVIRAGQPQPLDMSSADSGVTKMIRGDSGRGDGDDGGSVPWVYTERKSR